MTTPFLARMFNVRPSLATAMPRTLPECWCSRTRAVIRCLRRIATPSLRALASSGRINPMPEEPVRASSGATAFPVCICGPVHRCGVVLSGCGVARGTGAKIVRSFFHENHAMRHQELEGRGAVVGKGTDNFLIVVAIVWKPVRLDDGPVGQIGEQQVWRIDNAVFLLNAGTASKRHVAAAQNRVAADVEVGFHHDDRSPALACGNRGG